MTTDAAINIGSVSYRRTAWERQYPSGPWGTFVVHLHAATGALVYPVEIGAGIGDSGLNLAEIRLRDVCQSLCRFCGDTAGKYATSAFIKNNLLYSFRDLPSSYA